jgi:hypothetical protein
VRPPSAIRLSLWCVNTWLWCVNTWLWCVNTWLWCVNTWLWCVNTWLWCVNTWLWCVWRSDRDVHPAPPPTYRLAYRIVIYSYHYCAGTRKKVIDSYYNLFHIGLISNIQINQQSSD